MKSGNKRLIYTVSFILLIAAGMLYKYVFKGNYDGITVLSASSASDSIRESSHDTSAESTVEMISIYICGEVNKPGIYRVEAGTILSDVADKAGGFTDNAALDHLNLVYIFTKNMSVFIPNDDNLSEGDSVIMRRSNDSNAGTDSNISQLVNINTSSKEQLLALPGIGESTASAIIKYREEHVFDSIEDIMNVSGIGEAKFSKIKDMICVR